MTRWLVAAGSLAIVVAWACTVDRPTDALECQQQADCMSPRVCESGYCVIDPDACPSECASCDLTQSPPLCTVTNTGGGSFTCPTGHQCNITCTGNDGCGNLTCGGGSTCTIMCSGGTAACSQVNCPGGNCNVTCTGAAACGNVSCGMGEMGKCDIQCVGAGACGNVTCNNACACDVTCGTGDCGQIDCPKVMGQTYCTASGSNDQPCESSPSNCNQC